MLNSETINHSKKDFTDDFRNLHEEFHLNSKWRSLHVILGVKPVKSSIKEVAKILDLDIEKANEAVEGLHTLGLLIKDGEHYKQGKAQYIIPNPKKEEQVRLDGHINQASQIINDLDLDQVHKGGGFGWTSYVCSNIETYQKYKKKYIDLMLEFEQESKDLEGNKIFKIALTSVSASVGGTND